MQKFCNTVATLHNGRALCIILYSGHGREDTMTGAQISGDMSLYRIQYMPLVTIIVHPNFVFVEVLSCNPFGPVPTIWYTVVHLPMTGRVWSA
jgi:hypothetical protein